jgi:hypothetical protein
MSLPFAIYMQPPSLLIQPSISGCNLISANNVGQWGTIIQVNPSTLPFNVGNVVFYNTNDLSMIQDASTNIFYGVLNEEKILSLYKWKNGNTEISQKKLQSIERIYFSEINKLNNINCLEDGRKYLEKLEGGAIWDVFWLHCLKPSIFPIFDQHTYRSMTKIKNGFRNS